MYAYNAAFYCDDCAHKIMKELDGVDSGDTDEYPQYASNDCESDHPEHCDGCGEFLGNSLTSDGADYVIQAWREDMAAGCTDSVACTIWREFYSWVDWPEWGACAYCGAVGELHENDDYEWVCDDCPDYLE